VTVDSPIIIELSAGETKMSDELKMLLEAAKKVQMKSSEQEEQRRSFAFGNTNIENSRITRATIDEEAESLKAASA
jgi:fructose/tagatose bisphosphate aldolase